MENKSGCNGLMISFLYHMLMSGFFTIQSQLTEHAGVSAQTARREFWDKGKK